MSEKGSERKWKSLSYVWLFETPWTDSSSPGSSVHRILQTRIPSGLPFPSPGDFPFLGMELWSPALQAHSLPTESQCQIIQILSEKWWRECYIWQIWLTDLTEKIYECLYNPHRYIYTCIKELNDVQFFLFFFSVLLHSGFFFAFIYVFFFFLTSHYCIGFAIHQHSFFFF